MILSTVMSLRRKRRSVICCSVASSTPASVAWAIIPRISSSVISGSRGSLRGTNRRTRSVDRPSRWTRGVARVDRRIMCLAARAAIRSGLLRAILLGTSSPRISVAKVTPTTTRTTVISYPMPAGSPARINRGERVPASLVPPKAPAATATAVMPTWTVERNRLGEFARSSARAEARSPSLALWCRRAFLALTTAISAPARRPLAMMSRTRTVSSSSTTVRSIMWGSGPSCGIQVNHAGMIPVAERVGEVAEYFSSVPGLPGGSRIRHGGRSGCGRGRRGFRCVRWGGWRRRDAEDGPRLGGEEWCRRRAEDGAAPG